MCTQRRTALLTTGYQVDSQNDCFALLTTRYQTLPYWLQGTRLCLIDYKVPYFALLTTRYHTLPYWLQGSRLCLIDYKVVDFALLTTRYQTFALLTTRYQTLPWVPDFASLTTRYQTLGPKAGPPYSIHQRVWKHRTTRITLPYHHAEPSDYRDHVTLPITVYHKALDTRTTLSYYNHITSVPISV